MSWINSTFPAAVGAHEIKSPCTDDYNCIAYAAGDQSEWWSNHPGYKWPAKRTPLVSGLVEVFKSLGFEVCDSGELEPGFEKVALYAKRDMWKHAARQREDGKWVSKLGPEEDIEHATADCMCGDAYGTIHCFMKRSRT